MSKSRTWGYTPVIPPNMFECVAENVYRSNLITEENILFIDRFNLETVVMIGNNKLNENVLSYFKSHNINLVFDIFIFKTML